MINLKSKTSSRRTSQNSENGDKLIERRINKVNKEQINVLSHNIDSIKTLAK